MKPAQVHDTYLNLGLRKSNITGKYDKDCIFTVKSNCSIIIEGNPGSGKTVLCGQIMAQMPHRNMLIVDYNGEHYYRLRQIPVNAKRRSWFLPEIYNAQFPAISPVELTRYDLVSLNLAEGGAIVMQQLLKMPDLTWEKMQKAIIALPVDIKDLVPWNVKNKLAFQSTINRYTKQSLITKLPVLEEIFGHYGIQYNIPAIWKKRRQVCIDFNFSSMNEAAILRSRLYLGKYLEKIWPYLHQFSPVFVIEEAKIPWPRLAESEGIFKSYDRLNSLQLHQRRRTGSMIIAVIQNYNHISLSIQDTYDWRIKHQFTDKANNRYFVIGDMNFFNNEGRGRHAYFKVHNIEY